MNANTSIEASCFEDPNILATKMRFRDLVLRGLLVLLATFASEKAWKRHIRNLLVDFLQSRTLIQQVENVQELLQFLLAAIMLQLQAKGERQNFEYIHLFGLAVRSH